MASLQSMLLFRRQRQRQRQPPVARKHTQPSSQRRTVNNTVLLHRQTRCWIWVFAGLVVVLQWCLLWAVLRHNSNSEPHLRHPSSPAYSMVSHRHERTKQKRNHHHHSLLQDALLQQQGKLGIVQGDRLLTCDELFGTQSLKQVNDYCFQHLFLKWVSCRLGSRISIHTQYIDGSNGGENPSNVQNRSESEELLTFRKGALMIHTNPLISWQLQSPLLPSFSNNNNNNSGTRSLWMTQSFDQGIVDFLDSTVPNHAVYPPTNKNNQTIALLVRRGDYANPCMALLSMYNTYMVLHHLFLPTSNYAIIWLDGHAEGSLDTVWKDLFGVAPVHIKQLERNINGMMFHDAIVVNTMSAIGDEGYHNYDWRRYRTRHTYNCTLDPNHHTLVAFRDFVLQRHHLTRKSLFTRLPKQMTLLVRKDFYMAHPRSNGHTDRTLWNVTDDVEYLQSLYPDYKLTVVSFEGVAFRQQLAIMTQTDLFVSVHGAGNVHTLFLPDHATFIEYIPSTFRKRMRFRYLAECLNLTYIAKKAWAVQDNLNQLRFLRRKQSSPIQVRLRPQTGEDMADPNWHQDHSFGQ